MTVSRIIDCDPSHLHRIATRQRLPEGEILDALESIAKIPRALWGKVVIDRTPLVRRSPLAVNERSKRTASPKIGTVKKRKAVVKRKRAA